MKLLTRVFLVFGITVLPLSGCMMGMHGMEREPSRQQPAKSIEKEFTARDVAFTLEVSPLVIGEDATLILRAYHIQQETSVSGAKVTYRIERIERSGEHAENHVSVTKEREADEIAGKGVYQLRYRVNEGGLYKITARLWMEGKDEAAAPLSVSLTQEVVRHENHDEASRNTWLIIGGIGMAAMMAIMIL